MSTGTQMQDYGLRGGIAFARRISPARGMLYRDAHYFTATVDVDPERMRRWLPRGIRLTRPARADVFTAWFPHCSYGSIYHESGIFVHIDTLRGNGIHCPWMILDDDVALILGRELLGYPKKMGEIDWTYNGTHLDARATRRGHTLIEMAGTVEETLPQAPPILGKPHRNVVGTLGLSLPRVVAFTPREHPIETRRVDLHHFSIGGSSRDPLHLMGLGQVVEARLHRVDLGSAMPPTPLRPLTPLFSLTRLRPRVM